MMMAYSVGSSVLGAVGGSGGGAMAAGETYCLCGQPYAAGQFMIECDCCREWFHGGCVNVKIYQSEDIDKYHCPKCVPTYGNSIYKVPTNIHRQDRYELNADLKPTQTGSGAFVTDLASRVFPTNHVIQMDPRNFSENYLKDRGFNQPLLFENSAGLDLRVPPAGTFTVRTVERHCGADREVDVIDVTRQTNFKMPLGDFVDYFTEPNRSKVLNVLSLEFSDTSMSGLVQPPSMARQLDWVRVVWPNNGVPFAPLVQKYCIMSAAASYTDFHIDFGGTTVWYHVMHGKKVFYMIPPTQTNLTLYQQWSTSVKQNEVFFGDLVDSCSTCILKRGQTLFIPTGWIHAVLTPEDSLVFGGNFLHSYNIELQLQINEIEKSVETPSMFRFPLFETIHWYAGAYLLSQIRRINEEQQDEDFTLEENKFDMPDRNSKILLDLPPHLISGIRVLAATLKEWNSCKAFDPVKKQNIPETVNSGQLVRDLSKELRRLEKLLVPSYPSQNTFNNKKKKRPRPQMIIEDVNFRPPVNNANNRHFSSVSKEHGVVNNVNLPAMYDSSNARSLYNTHSNQSKKSLKLTLPKPIMHVPDSPHMFSNSSQDSEDAELSNMATIASRSGIASYSQNYDSQDSFGGENDYRIPGENGEYERKPKKSNQYSEVTSNERGGAVLKIKLGSSPPVSMDGSIRNHGPPPDYTSTEHSILKTHLINNTSNVRHQKPSNQWTISKSQVKNNTTDSTDEQILFTNENLSMPGTSHSNISTYMNANMQFDSGGMMYGPGMYTGDNNPPIPSAQTENYNPDFIIDRKNAGMSLPDYSPTKSITEYLGNTKPAFIDPPKSALPGNFANNSDPYSQTIRSQDGISPFSDDSSVLTNEGYQLVQEDEKNIGILQNKVPIFSQTNYEYIDADNRRQQEYVIIDEETGAVIKRGKNFNKQAYAAGVARGQVISTHDNILIYSGNVNSHNMIDGMNPNPPPSYESAVAPRRTERPARRRIDPRSSIYDYEDQDEIDEGDLYIDEAPKPANPKRKRKPPPNKDKLPAAVLTYGHDGIQDNDSRVPEAFAAPKNGIESLLQASEYTGSPGADNQERDAVAGMLSIGQSYGLARPGSSNRQAQSDTPPIRAVHRDDEFVYPSLDVSSDDDDDVSPSRLSSSRSKRKRHPFSSPPGDRSDGEDESWCPTGHVGRLVPRANRPTRRGSRREAVQAALRAARLRGVSEPSIPHSEPPVQPASLPTTHSTSVNRPPIEPIHRPPVVTPSLPIREPMSLSNLKKPHRKKRHLVRPTRPVTMHHLLPTPASNNRDTKFKKGMKTAKQRLGKILKIHKMMC